VHVPDPHSPREVVADALAAQFAPEYRVLSIDPRHGQPYQIQAMDILATLDQFGFEQPILVGERLGCVAALLLAAWHPTRVERLVLIDATYVAQGNSLEARSLRDCPPGWTTMRAAVHCPVLEVPWNTMAIEAVRTLLQIP